MDRFFRYSLEHKRAIRMMWMEADGRLSQGRVVVEAIGKDAVDILVLRPPRKLSLAFDRVLSCDYAPDDDGLQ